MSRTITTTLLGLLLLSLGACQNDLNNWKDYYAYLHAPENGLIKEKTIGDMKFTMQYWPAAMRSQEQPNPEQEEDSWTFLLKIEASEQAAQPFDVMTETVSSLEEFQEQTLALNFDWQKWIYLQVKDKKVAPVLAVLENTYGLQQHRVVNLVFAKEERAVPQQLDLVFEDTIFGTGKHHFLFQTQDLEAIPALALP